MVIVDLLYVLYGFGRSSKTKVASRATQGTSAPFTALEVDFFERGAELAQTGPDTVIDARTGVTTGCDRSAPAKPGIE
jgi:hypothetical protein